MAAAWSRSMLSAWRSSSRNLSSGLQDRAVGGGHVAGDRVGRFPQPFGQRLVHQAEQRVEPVLFLEQLEHRLRHGPRAVRVVVAEDRQVVHDLLDLHQFGGADRLVRDRHGDHDGDERILRAEGVIGHRVWSFGGVGPRYLLTPPCRSNRCGCAPGQGGPGTSLRIRPMTELRDAAMTSKAWPFEEARRLLKRYEKAPPAKGHVLFETGYGPSGLPHIGTFGEVLRTTMIRRAFEVISDIPTRLICFSDDMDGMRKVPGNVPNQEMLREHLQKPLTSVPDPFGEFESFGHHNNAMLRRFLDTFGFDYEFYSATDFYASGQFDEILLRAAERYDALMKVMLKSLREERQQTYSIFLPLHPETGRVLYVPIKHVDAKDGTVTFDDEDGPRMDRPRHRRQRASCSGSPISARAGPRSASISRCMARTIRRTRRSTTRSARSSGRPRRNTSPTSCSSTRTGRRSPSLPATASPSTNG
jgi:hypothetical protein